MKRISTAKIAAILLISTSVLINTSARAECGTQCDEIIVRTVRPIFGASFWVMNIFYSGGVSGGGSGPFLREAAFLEDLPAGYVALTVPQRHRIDLNDDGAFDAEFEGGFIIFGADDDGDYRPDAWDRAVTEFRAWPY